MDNKLVAVTLSVVVGLILAGSVLMPVIDDATKTEKTFKNQGLFFLTEEQAPTLHYVFNDNIWTVNDAALDTPSGYGAYNIIVFDNSFIRQVGQLRGDYGYSFNSADFTISNNTLSGTLGTNTVDISFESGYFAVPYTSSFIMTANQQPIYCGANDVLSGRGMVSVGADLIPVYWEGTIKDGIIWGTQSSTHAYTFTDTEIEFEQIDEFKDLYLISSINCIAHVDGQGNVPVKFTQYIAPSETTAEYSKHLSDSQNMVIFAIPLMVIVSLLVGVVQIFRARND